MKRIVVGITGASGVIYGVRLVQTLIRLNYEVHLIVTDAGWIVFNQELGWDTSDRNRAIMDHLQSDGEGKLYYYGIREFTAPVASGSFQTDGMIVIPCSMGTLSGIAHGASGNLLERVADVMLKEGRKLVVVPRETPLNSIHLENMLTLSRAGAHILPAMPGFYHGPVTMDDLIHFVVGKALDLLGIHHHNLFKRWGS
jgi:4-hydroxy-3-polyprenylbenzoate decarboxylase